MAAELRSRGKESEKDMLEGKGAQKRRKRRGMPIKMEWDSLFWMLAAFSVLYVSEFASHIIFDDIVKRHWLVAAMLALTLCLSCLGYALYSCPSLDISNWHVKTPYLIPIATVSALTGSISLSVAVWPVWRYYTILIMPVLFMGFISTVSLFNL